MIVDQDRPSTWVKYRETLCQSCNAICCKLPLEVKMEDLVRLGWANLEDSPKKVAKNLLKEKRIRSYRASSGLFMLEQKQNRDCIFLSDDRTCKVYDKRPNVCRGFPLKLGPRLCYCPYVKKPV